MVDKRPKPKWGHRAKGVFDDFGKEHYSIEESQDIISGFAFSIEISDVKKKLDIAANQYFQTRSMFEDAPTHGESRVALEFLQKHAKALRKGLEALDDKSWNLVLGAEIEASYQLLREGTVRTRLGYEMGSVRHEDGSISYDMLSPQDFIGAAEFIEVYIADGLAHAPSGKSGKRPLLSLRGWLNHMEPLWSDGTGRPFTLDFHKGVPISNAAIFCKRAISVIDSGVTDANLITAIRGKR
tara:strand:- start:62 stop:781 length:720 start_codon:yes stop_codon:yes gene_type:complete